MLLMSYVQYIFIYMNVKQSDIQTSAHPGATFVKHNSEITFNQSFHKRKQLSMRISESKLFAPSISKCRFKNIPTEIISHKFLNSLLKKLSSFGTLRYLITIGSL